MADGPGADYGHSGAGDAGGGKAPGGGMGGMPNGAPDQAIMAMGAGGFPGGMPGQFPPGMPGQFPGGFPGYPPMDYGNMAAGGGFGQYPGYGGYGMYPGMFPGYGMYPGMFPQAGGMGGMPGMDGQAAPQAAGAHGGRPAAGANLNNMMPGDWLCPSCGDHVFARNRNCRRCGAAKPEGAGDVGGLSSFADRGLRAPGAGGGGGNQKALPGDWNCPKCQDLQFARNKQCRMCGTPKPEDVGADFSRDRDRPPQRRGRSRSRSRSRGRR